MEVSLINDGIGPEAAIEILLDEGGYFQKSSLTRAIGDVYFWISKTRASLRHRRRPQFISYLWLRDKAQYIFVYDGRKIFYKPLGHFPLKPRVGTFTWYMLQQIRTRFLFLLLKPARVTHLAQGNMIVHASRGTWREIRQIYKVVTYIFNYLSGNKEYEKYENAVVSGIVREDGHRWCHHSYMQNWSCVRRGA